MTDQNRPVHSAEEELAALGFYAPASGGNQQPDSVQQKPSAPDAALDTDPVVNPDVDPQEPGEPDVHSDADVSVALSASSAQEVPAPQDIPAVHEVAAPQDIPEVQDIPEPQQEADGLSVRDRALSIVDHLTDLRKRLILSLVAFVIFLILSLFFVEKIYLFLTAPLGMKLTVLGPAEIIHVYFMIGGLAALVPTIPFVMWQLWLFVAPGLTERERRITLTYIPAVLLVFIAGLLFGRFLVFPSLMKVLYGFSTQYTNYMPTADSYFSFMVRLLVPFGFIFEMPIIILFLTRLGILNPIRLTKFRKYAYFFIVLISFMLTPPEITSHLSLTVPMILLYELSIQISKYAYRKRLRMQQQRESA